MVYIITIKLQILYIIYLRNNKLCDKIKITL